MSVDSPGNDVATEYEGYADYRRVSDRVGRTVHEAMMSYATIESMHSESARVKARAAASAKRDILAAALMIETEVEASGKSGNEPFEDWGEEEQAMEWVSRLRETELQTRCPEWLSNLVETTREAAWQLGYLKAGREVNDHGETPDGKAESMFEGL